MRRIDREITNPQKIQAIIASCTCCRLGFYDQGEVYIVPLSFGYFLQDGRYSLYFHGAKEGRKIDLISTNPSVGFEMDTHHKIKVGKTACESSASFQSIIGSGRISLVETRAEKIAGLQAIMLHNTGKGDWSFSDERLDAVCVFKLEVEKMSCKENL